MWALMSDWCKYNRTSARMEVTDLVWPLMLEQDDSGTFLLSRRRLHLLFCGKKIHILQAKPRLEYSNYAGRIPGKVVARNKKSGTVIVLTKDSGIEIIQIKVDEIEKSPFETFNTVRKRCTSRIDAYLDFIGF